MNVQPDLSTMKKGQQFIAFGHLFNFLATSEETNGRYFIYEDFVPPGGGPPLHTHPDEELFYIMEGEFEFVLNDLEKPFRPQPGALVRIPGMAVHTFRNIGNSTGKMLTILLPGKLEQYFRAVGLQVEEESQVPDLSVAPDFASMDLTKALSLAPEHNVVFVGLEEKIAG